MGPSVPTPVQLRRSTGPTFRWLREWGPGLVHVPTAESCSWRDLQYGTRGPTEVGSGSGRLSNHIINQGNLTTLLVSGGCTPWTGHLQCIDPSFSVWGPKTSDLNKNETPRRRVGPVPSKVRWRVTRLLTFSTNLGGRRPTGPTDPLDRRTHLQTSKERCKDPQFRPLGPRVVVGSARGLP